MDGVVACYLIRLGDFRNIGLYQQGWYSIAITVGTMDRSKSGPGHDGTLTAQAEAIGHITHDAGEADDPHQPGLDRTVCTTPFFIRYKGQLVSIRDVFEFKLSLSRQSCQHEDQVLKVELLLSQLKDSVPTPFKVVSTRVYGLRNTHTTPLFEHIPCTFDEFHASMVDCFVFAAPIAVAKAAVSRPRGFWATLFHFGSRETEYSPEEEEEEALQPGPVLSGSLTALRQWHQWSRSILFAHSVEWGPHAHAWSAGPVEHESDAEEEVINTLSVDDIQLSTSDANGPQPQPGTPQIRNPLSARAKGMTPATAAAPGGGDGGGSSQSTSALEDKVKQQWGRLVSFWARPSSDQSQDLECVVNELARSCAAARVLQRRKRLCIRRAPTSVLYVHADPPEPAKDHECEDAQTSECASAAGHGSERDHGQGHSRDDDDGRWPEEAIQPADVSIELNDTHEDNVAHHGDGDGGESDGDGEGEGEGSERSGHPPSLVKAKAKAKAQSSLSIEVPTIHLDLLATPNTAANGQPLSIFAPHTPFSPLTPESRHAIGALLPDTFPHPHRIVPRWYRPTETFPIHVTERRFGAMDVDEMPSLNGLGMASPLMPSVIGCCTARPQAYDTLSAVPSSMALGPGHATSLTAHDHDHSIHVTAQTARHLVVLCHGLAANRYDVQYIRNYITERWPGAETFTSTTNEADTLESIETLGQRLAKEIHGVASAATKPPVDRMSFICHSLGGVIARAALHQEDMAGYRPAFCTFVTIACPHLGNAYAATHVRLVQRAWALFHRRARSILELAMRDAPRPQDCYLYKLAKRGGLEHFHKVVLVASDQDHYVPFDSALMQVGHAEAMDPLLGPAHIQMVDGLLGPLSGPPSTHDPMTTSAQSASASTGGSAMATPQTPATVASAASGRHTTLLRMEVNFSHIPHSVNALIGRAAHLELLDNDQWVQLFLDRTGPFN